MKNSKRLVTAAALESLALVLCFCTGCVPLGQERDVVEQYMVESQVESLVARSVQYMERGSRAGYDQARATLELARELEPNDPLILDAIGCVEWRRGYYREAEHYFRRAVAADPEYDAGYVHLALVAERNGDMQAATELLQIALQLNPLNARGRNNMAALWLNTAPTETKKSREAYKLLLQALQSSGNETEVILHNLEQIE